MAANLEDILLSCQYEYAKFHEYFPAQHGTIARIAQHREINRKAVKEITIDQSLHLLLGIFIICYHFHFPDVIWNRCFWSDTVILEGTDGSIKVDNKTASHDLTGPDDDLAQMFW